MKKLMALALMTMLPQIASAITVNCEVWQKLPGKEAETKNVSVDFPEDGQIHSKVIGQGIKLTHYPNAKYDNPRPASGLGVLMVEVWDGNTPMFFEGTTEHVGVNMMGSKNPALQFSVLCPGN